MNKKHRLEDSSVFCIAPWLSVNIKPNGDIIPCCIARGNEFGNLNQDDIETIWNNENYKKFRKKLLNDEKCFECEKCYVEESKWGNNFTLRKHLNKYYGDMYEDLVEKETNPDGSVNKMNFLHWDFRFNNLCNLSCIGCSPQFSSMWVDLDKRMYPDRAPSKIYSSRDKREKFLNTIKTQANVVKDVYFAGGEPLIQPEHYEILEELDKVGKIDKINFCYSTNLTMLKYKDINVIDYWKKMSRVNVLVSLDEVDPQRLHYIRYPSDVNEIMKNIEIIDKELSTADKTWTFTPTWNLLNTHRMKDIMGYFYNRKLLPEIFYISSKWEHCVYNIILMFPDHMSISAASPEWKQVLHSKINEYEEWYIDCMVPLKEMNIRQPSVVLFKESMTKFRKAIDTDITVNRDAYKDWYRRLDAARDTNFKEVFPELSWYLT